LAFFEDDATATGQTQRRDRLNEAERVGEGGDTSGTPNALQGGTGAAEARLARDVGLVHRGGEAIRLSEAVERFAPGALMRGCEQNAVDVENARVQRLGMIGSAPRGFGDGDDGCTLPLLRRELRHANFPS
jgi:hypothetical protein